MSARDIIEAETPKGIFRQVATPENRIAAMKFYSKDEIYPGRKILYRHGDGWTPEQDKYYRITGSDWYRVGGFYRYNPKSHWGGPVKVPKKQSDYVGLHGVVGMMISWEKLYAQCLKPELYYPDMKMQGMPFNRPPDQRY